MSAAALRRSFAVKRHLSVVPHALAERLPEPAPEPARGAGGVLDMVAGPRKGPHDHAFYEPKPVAKLHRGAPITPGAVGAGAVEPQPGSEVTVYEMPMWYQAVTIAGGVAGAYHGYKRNDSIGWAIWWSLNGTIFPFVTVPIALAQGFGKRAGR
jgi:hypothetical protein